MKKFLLATAAVTTCFAVPAHAADLARNPPPVYAPPPVVVPVFSWTGCYVGGNGGGFWSRREWFDDSGFFDRAGGSRNLNGGLGGAQVGCNYQTGNWVFGIQGDYDWVGASGSTTTGPAFAFLAPGSVSQVTVSGTVNSLASVTGRVGYAWDRFLGYVKGGGAWVNEEATLGATFVGVGAGTIGSVSDTRGGWTVGIGGEYAFRNWLTGFIEYDHYGFGIRTFNFNCTLATVCAIPPGLSGAGALVGTVPIDIRHTADVLKVGLNVKFGGWNFGGW